LNNILKSFEKEKMKEIENIREDLTQLNKLISTTGKK
jgi:hypothetical protein